MFSLLSLYEIKFKINIIVDRFNNRCRHFFCSPELDNTELYQIDGLRERLISKISIGIEDAMESICDALQQLNNISQVISIYY